MSDKKILTLDNQERAIDSLARHNHIIKSLFHFEKPITFLIISLGVQKVRGLESKKGSVIIERREIKSLATGKDAKLGINKLIKNIVKDIEDHNHFNFYHPNSRLKNIRQVLTRRTAITDDIFEDLLIKFDEDLFETFNTKTNYTIQSLEELRKCGVKQRIKLYEITQPYAKSGALYKLNIPDIKLYLEIGDDAYPNPRSLTLRIKRLCEQITKITDINLTVTPIKISGKTTEYQFHSEFKKQKNSTPKIESTKAIYSKPTSIRQQLTIWGVGKKQIDTWLANLSKKTINDAIKQTLNRPERRSKTSNAGGYIYSILGNGKQLQLTTQIKADEVVDCLKKFGLSVADIKSAQEKLKQYNGALTAVVNKCLRELSNDVAGTQDMRQFFIDELDKVVTELN